MDRHVPVDGCRCEVGLQAGLTTSPDMMWPLGVKSKVRRLSTHLDRNKVLSILFVKPGKVWGIVTCDMGTGGDGEGP